MSKVWAPTDHDLEWFKDMFSSLNENGVWVVPDTGQTFIKKGDALVWSNEHLGDKNLVYERSKSIGSGLGIDVIKESEL